MFIKIKKSLKFAHLGKVHWYKKNEIKEVDEELYQRLIDNEAGTPVKGKINVTEIEDKKVETKKEDDKKENDKK